MANLIRTGQRTGGEGRAASIQARMTERRKRKQDAEAVEAIIGALDPASNRGQAAASTRGKGIGANQLLQILSLIGEDAPEQIDNVDFYRDDGEKMQVAVPRSVRAEGGQRLNEYGRQKIGSSGWATTPPPKKAEAPRQRTVDVYNQTEGKSAKIDLSEELLAKGPLEVEQELVRLGMPGYSIFKQDAPGTAKAYRYLDDGTVEEREIGITPGVVDPDEIEKIAQAKGFTTVKRTPPDPERAETVDNARVRVQTQVWKMEPTPQNMDRARHYVNFHDDAKREVASMFNAIKEGDMYRPPADPFNNYLWSLANQVLDSPEGPLAGMKTVSEAAISARDSAFEMLRRGIGFPEDVFAPNKSVHFIPAVNYLRQRVGFTDEDVEQYLTAIGLTDEFLSGQGYMAMFDKQGQKITHTSTLATTLGLYGGVFDAQGNKRTM